MVRLRADRNALRQLKRASANFGLHPSCANFAGDGQRHWRVRGQAAAAFVSNVGTLVHADHQGAVQCVGERPERRAARAQGVVFAQRSDRAMADGRAAGLAQLSGWAGRCADICTVITTRGNSMSISLGGNNVFQVGNTTQQFVITPSGALSFEGNTGGANPIRSRSRTRRCAGTLDQITQICSRKVFAAHASERRRAVAVQTQFDSANAQLGAAVDALFPPANYVATTLKAVVKTIKIRSQLGFARQTFFVQYGGWDHRRTAQHAGGHAWDAGCRYRRVSAGAGNARFATMTSSRSPRRTSAARCALKMGAARSRWGCERDGLRRQGGWWKASARIPISPGRPERRRARRTFVAEHVSGSVFRRTATLVLACRRAI